MRTFLAGLCSLVLVSSAAAGKDEEERLTASAAVLREILDMPESIPSDLLHRAECVVVLPSVKKFALGIGGKYGRGAMVCRQGEDFQGRWGPPAMVRLEGANIGFQIGGEAIDYLLLIMNQKGAQSLLKSKVKLGADASAVAGPKGRTAEASTDAYMRAEILSYSRSRGLFAGVSLEGSTLRPDNDGNRKLYGRRVSAREIVRGGAVGVPASGEELVATLQSASPENRSN